MESITNKIHSVCWNITEKCNEKCIFCYRTLSDDLSYENNLSIAKKLLQHGVKKITFAGGEPLLYKNILELAKFIKSQNPDIILSLTTNGMLINDNNIQAIIDTFDWISLDIESIYEDYHKFIGRGENHLNHNLELLAKLNNKINIKINTVATHLNFKDIPYIFHIISKFNVKRWKIFRYYPINFIAKDNNDLLSITDEEYKTISEKLSLVMSPFQIEFNDTADFETSYFSIYPNGDLKNERAEVVANVLKEKINSSISKIKLDTHYVRQRNYEQSIERK